MDRKFKAGEEEKLVTKAQKQFKAWMSWEGNFRESFEEDIRFCAGDSDNQWQWDVEILQNRKTVPSMTVNMTLIHCLLIQNDIKKNPPAILVRPTGGGATAKSAEVYGGLIREISRASDATQIYLKASESLIQGGVGYWRVLNEYEDEESFDQVIRIRSIRNPMCVAIDPDAKEPSGADANWGIIFEDIKDEYLEEEYEKYKDVIGSQNAISQSSAYEGDWETEDHTRVAEWYTREKFEDQLLGFMGGDGQPVTSFLSDIEDAEIKRKLLSDTNTQRRTLVRSKICWYKIIGNRIVDYKETPGRKYIPIVRVIGQEAIVGGQLDRKGMVRNLKNPQQNLNYWVSAGAMQVALQTNVPWVGPAAAFENIKGWEDANTSRAAYLTYNHRDADGDIPAPTRPGPPVLAPAYISGIQLASQQFKDISGQHEASQGMPGQEVSGVAIDSRKIQGETSTYHFPAALAQGVAHTGRIIVDMVPKVYDTERLIRISNVDMSQTDVQVNPGQTEPHQEVENPDEENATTASWNPAIGRYEVEAEAGPDYATQRQWTADVMGKILSNNKDLWPVIGDIFVESIDTPGHEEMAERLRRTMNPAVLGKGPSPNEQKMQQQLQHGQQLMESLVETLKKKQQELDDKNEELRIKQEDIDIKLGDAMTRRIKEVGNAQSNFAAAGLEPDIKAIMGQTAVEALREPLASSLSEPEPEPAE